jgi:hypothetical protein
MPLGVEARITRLLDKLEDPKLPAKEVESLERRIDYLRAQA